MKLRSTRGRIAARARRLSDAHNQPSSSKNNQQPHCLQPTPSGVISPVSILSPMWSLRPTNQNNANFLVAEPTAQHNEPSSSAISTKCPEPNEHNRRIDVLFTVLHKKHSKVELQGLAGAIGLIKRGNKSHVVSRFMLQAIIHEHKGKDVPQCFNNASLSKAFDAYQEEHRSCEKCPDVFELLEGVLECERPKWKRLLQDEKFYSSLDDANGEQASESVTVPEFSLNEFARLCILLRDDDLSRAAMRNAVGLELTRLPLENGTTRDSFWGTVEKRFNNTAVVTEENFTGSLDGIDSNRAPLAHRSASQLKTQYNDSKKDFTNYHSMWNQSGQNDPQRFVDFLPKFRNDLLSASKRSFVLFIVCRCGTPNVDTDLLHLVSHVTAADVGYDTVEQEKESSLDGPLRKKKRGSDDSASMLKDCLSQASKTSVCNTEAFNKNLQTVENDERDARVHRTLELLRAELRNRRLDNAFEEDDVGAKAELFLKEWSVKHMNNLMKSLEGE